MVLKEKNSSDPGILPKKLYCDTTADCAKRRAASVIEARKRTLKSLSTLHHGPRPACAWLERLSRSNEDLELFAYAASHDLQEPLRMVTSYLKLLEKRCGDSIDRESQEYLHFAVDGAERMRDLIKNLLTYSRVATSERVNREVDCEQVFGECLANLKCIIEETEAVITHDPLPVIGGDKAELVRLFQNLIGNALKYRSTRIPEIHIQVEKREDDWLFSVSDNGIGIERSCLKEVFRKFRRFHDSNFHRGTGLGLAICERIVERHGGRIWVESELGVGSKFYFTIPFSIEANVRTQ